MRSFSKYAALPFLLGLLATTPLSADVDLVTIPTREGVQLTIYNSEDLTMVREHRLLTVKKGINRIQFSWSQTLIDPTSIDFRILGRQDEVTLRDTTFPAGRNDALQWNIDSQFAGKLPVEIRYFTSGVTWSADYVGIANQDETELKLTGYVRVKNGSGEEYDNANVRLVVGNINLVEKIAQLAQRPAPPIPTLSADMRRQLHSEFDKAVRRALVPAAPANRPAASAMPSGPVPVPKPKQVVKQGLSEYFLFAIDGREDINVNEPKRLVSMDVAKVPLEVIYKLSDRNNASAFTKYYRFKNLQLKDDDGNDKDLPAMENLGLSPLPNGAVRLFSEYKNKDLAYVGGTQTKYVGIGDRVEVNVGREPSITISKTTNDQRITNVTARQYKRRLDNTYVLYFDLIDYDETFYIEEEIVCGKDNNCKVEVERRFADNVFLFANDEKPEGWDDNKPGAYIDMTNVPGRVERVDTNHVKYFLDLKPGERTRVKYTVTYKRRKVGPEINGEKRREPIR